MAAITSARSNQPINQSTMKHIYALLFVYAISTCILNSQVINISGIWTTIGDVRLSAITNDADNGDGVGDGAQFIDGKSAVVGQGASFTFSGTMTSGETLSVDTYTYNQNSSFVKFVVDLYNVTDQTVLATSGTIFISNSSAAPVLTSLNYMATPSDIGDVVQVRYIRNDDGHTARNFAIDNISLNGEFVTADTIVSCPFTATPDIALEGSNASNEADINLMVARYSDDYLGPSAPSVSELNAAIFEYNALNISVNSGEISGDNLSSFKDVDFLKTFAQQLKFNSSDTDTQEKARNTIWHTSKQFCDGVIALDHNGYQFKHFGQPAILLKSILTQEIINLFEYLLFKRFNEYQYFWEANYDESFVISNGPIDTDYIYNHADIQLAYALWPDTEEERLQYIKGYKRYIERFFSYTPGTADGIKEDGSGFHHRTAYNNYLYAYKTAANVLYYMEGTSFKVNQNAYKVFRDAVYNQYMQANDYGIQALSTSGRNPQNRIREFNQDHLKKLAIAGGDILGLSTADPILAGMYNRVYGVDGDFNYSGTTAFTTGFFQFNHASASVFRKDDWVAFNKGFTSNMWGSEIYIGDNRYGRYQSYGALEVIYPGNKETGNGYDPETWDWNYNPGTTVIRLPWANLHAERGRVDELQQKRFAGALNLKNNNSEVLANNHGDYGMFAMDFKEQEGLGFGVIHSSGNHNKTFTFKKSNFYFDDIIVCLASGINNNDTSNETITTLYQRIDNRGIPNVNGASQSSFGETTFSGASDNWLLSNYNTGFYLLSGNHSLKIKKEIQQTPNESQIWPASIGGNATDSYYTGYIDHGTNPSNESYEYILKPNTDVATMQTLQASIQGGNKPYTVHKQDANAHIVEHELKKVFGYAFFNAVSGLGYDKIIGVNASCLIMTEYNDANGELYISAANPDLGFEHKSYAPSIQVTRLITLQGEWTLSSSEPGVEIISISPTETVIAFTLVDGLAKEVLLITGIDCPLSKQGTSCDDGDDCTINDIYDENCDCIGVIEDTDSDGVCDADDQCPGFDDTIDANNNGIPDGCDVDCTYAVINFNDFESGWGIWNDGGSDSRRSSSDATYALGTYCARLRDNTYSSVMTTDVLDLSNYEELTIDFSYYPRSMDNSNEDFWLQISTNGGSNYTTVEEWNVGDEFNNNQRYYDQVVLNGPFTSNTRLRFRCDASGNSDWVYIDDVSISGCGSGGASNKSINPKKANVVNIEEPIADESKERLEMKLYPNPASEFITVKLADPSLKIERIRILDLNGRIVNEITINKTNTHTINVSRLESGVYFISTVVKGNAKAINEKFIVRK